MNELDSLFTIASLVSLQGSAAAALLVPNVLTYLVGNAFKPYAKWVSFAISMGLAYLVAALAPDSEWTKWIVALFNGFLVFASAVGINEAAGGRAVAEPGLMGVGDETGAAPGGGRFFESWF
jgi:hypothetical protein